MSRGRDIKGKPIFQEPSPETGNISDSDYVTIRDGALLNAVDSGRAAAPLRNSGPSLRSRAAKNAFAACLRLGGGGCFQLPGKENDCHIFPINVGVGSSGTFHVWRPSSGASRTLELRVGRNDLRAAGRSRRCEIYVFNFPRWRQR